MQTSVSCIFCFLEPDFFLTLNERLSVSFRSLNVSKLEMVAAGKDPGLALLFVRVAALLLTLLVVPTCEILSPHFGQKNTILEAYSHTFHRRPQFSNTYVGPQSGLGKYLSLDPGSAISVLRYNSVLEYLFLYWDKTLYWNIYFCSGIYIFLFWNIHISVLEYLFISALEYTF